MQKVILGFSLIIVFLVLFFWLGRPFESINCRNNRFRLDENFKGKVIKKEFNSKSHSNEIVFLSENSIFEWEEELYFKDSFYSKIELGDSLIKAKNELSLYVYREDTSFAINIELPCDTRN